MSHTYRDRPRRLVKEDARCAGFVTHLRPYGPLLCNRVEVTAYAHSIKGIGAGSADPVPGRMPSARNQTE